MNFKCEFLFWAFLILVPLILYEALNIMLQ